MLNALSWCLYGEEIHDYGQDASMDICNNKSLKLAENNSNVEVSVEIEFFDDNNELLAFRRSKIFHKTNDDLIAGNVFGDEFVVITQNGDDFDIDADTAYYQVDSRIPQEIEDYFFFDGARLAEYFQSTSNKKIKDAVFELSQLNLISSVTSNLSKVESKYISEQKKIAPKVGQVNDEIFKLEKKQKEYEKLLDKSKDIVSDSQNKIKEIDRELIDSNASEVENKVKRDKKLQKEIKRDKTELNEATDKRKLLIIKNYPYILAYNYFNNFLDYGESSREKGYIPPKFKRGFLEDLLKDKKCICGADLATDTEHRKAILKLLEDTNPLTDKSEEVTTALAHIKENILKNMPRFKSKLAKTKKEIKYYSKSIDEKNEERKEIKAFLKSHSKDKVKKLTAQKEDYENTLTTHTRNIGRYETELSIISKKLGELYKLRSKESGYKIQLEEFSDKIEFCKKSSKAAEIVRKTLVENMRINIQQLTKEKFLKIQWKDEEFVDIRLNNDYGVFIKNKTGKEERPGDLSDGEKLCLGLCFMSALHNISGFELPIVMDTPLGNLDKDMRHNIAEFLPEFMDGKQIVLLVTGTEYTDDFKNTLSPYIGKEYTIEWSNSEDGKESKVI